MREDQQSWSAREMVGEREIRWRPKKSLHWWFEEWSLAREGRCRQEQEWRKRERSSLEESIAEWDESTELERDLKIGNTIELSKPKRVIYCFVGLRMVFRSKPKKSNSIYMGWNGLFGYITHMPAFFAHNCLVRKDRVISLVSMCPQSTSK